MLSNDVGRLESENASLKKVLKELQTQFAEEQLKPKACEYCKFYIQHYVKCRNGYTKTYCGHCTHGRLKDRKPSDTCKYYELGTYEAQVVLDKK